MGFSLAILPQVPLQGSYAVYFGNHLHVQVIEYFLSSCSFAPIGTLLYWGGGRERGLFCVGGEGERGREDSFVLGGRREREGCVDCKRKGFFSQNYGV